jgi:hypothetical protein
MYNLPFCSTVLIDLKAGEYSGVQNSYIPWQEWLSLSPHSRNTLVEEAVRKYHLRGGISYSYEIASVLPNRVICAAVWYKPKTLDIQLPKNLQFGTVIAGRRHSNCFELALNLGLNIKEEDCVAGFLTANNLFLNRNDSYIAAYWLGQLRGGDYDPSQQLISEMLYLDE